MAKAASLFSQLPEQIPAHSVLAHLTAMGRHFMGNQQGWRG